MDSKRWKQVEALYNSAVELDTVDRAAFLDEVCAGDEGLRLEVLLLLSSAERADSFLEEPAFSTGLAVMGSERKSLVGERVGRYELLDLLGRGGMGEVYLALDPGLNRRVALKLLPTEIEGDSERVRRFEREARAASAISHPNVAHIYEIGDDRARHYIAMEYVAGRTLRQVMKQGPMDARAALDVAAQAAAALAAAHAAGVIHRDVKPENILLRDDGYVKVLDFGLAKLVEGRGLSAATGAMPPPTLLTEPELLMGTSDYMSPEQVRRESVDERTDLWSLGVVLYEMLAGRRPFEGRSASEVIVSVLEREPEPLGEIRPELPPALTGLVSKALLKGPDERYQTAVQLAAELKDARSRLREGVSPTGPSTGGGTHHAQPAQTQAESPGSNAERQGSTAGERRGNYEMLGLSGFPLISHISTRASLLTKRWSTTHWLVLLALVGVGIYLGLLHGRRLRLKDRDINLRFERLNLAGDINDIIISPDGKYVSSIVSEAGKDTIHITELATNSDLRIAPPSETGYSGLSFSPDGTYIYYIEKHVETGTLYRVSKLGGAQRKLIDNVSTAVTFSPDGTRMAFVRGDSVAATATLISANPEGQAEQIIAQRTRADRDSFTSDVTGASPVWSPDGKRLACPTIRLSQQGREMSLDVLDASQGSAQRLATKPWFDISRLAWLADGSGLIMAAKESPTSAWQLALISYPDGAIRPVTNDPNNYTRVSGTADSNVLLTLNVEDNSNIWLLASAGAERFAPHIISHEKGVSEVSWQADGKLLYTIYDGTNSNIWRQDIATGTRQQLTFTSKANFNFVTTHDQRYIVFASSRSGAVNLWRMNADGTQLLRLTEGLDEDMPAITADDQWVIYRSGDSLYKVSINGGGNSKLLDKIAQYPVVSPDGQQLACFVTEHLDSASWHLEIIDLRTLAVGKSLTLVEAAMPDDGLRWAPDGKALTYVSNADGASNLWLQPLNGERATRLTDFKDAQIQSFDWSADGRQIVCVRRAKTYVPVLVRLY